MTSLSAAHLKHLARVEQIKPVEPIVFEETAQSQYLVSFGITVSRRGGEEW